MKKLSIISIISLFLLIGCGNNNTFNKSPLDILIRDLTTYPSFTIILNDMDYDEGLDSYKHQYKILMDDNKGEVKDSLTGWYTVTDEFFDKHTEDMGMEVASKKDGKVHKTVGPAGYSNYVGNSQYGQWRERDGSRFWEYYGKYAMLSSVFRMGMYPVRYSYWNGYHTNYYNTGRSYYGPRNSGRYMYGTSSKYSSTSKSKWSSKPSSFKQKVRSKVKRSATTTKSKRIARRARQSSRFSSSRSRSRSGGFGK